MKHFFGGYAIGCLLIAWRLWENGRTKLGQALMGGFVYGWLFGIAA